MIFAVLFVTELAKKSLHDLKLYTDLVTEEKKATKIASESRF